MGNSIFDLKEGRSILETDKDDLYKLVIKGVIQAVRSVRELHPTEEFEEYLKSIGVDVNQFMYELYLEFKKNMMLSDCLNNLTNMLKELQNAFNKLTPIFLRVSDNISISLTDYIILRVTSYIEETIVKFKKRRAYEQ